MFTTTDPNGGNACVVTDKVTSVQQGTHVWMVVMFQDVMDDKPLTVAVYQNSKRVMSYTWPVNETKGQVCTWDRDMSDFASGTWTYIFMHDGKTEAEGTLTIK